MSTVEYTNHLTRKLSSNSRLTLINLTSQFDSTIGISEGVSFAKLFPKQVTSKIFFRSAISTAWLDKVKSNEIKGFNHTNSNAEDHQI